MDRLSPAFSPFPLFRLLESVNSHEISKTSQAVNTPWLPIMLGIQQNLQCSNTESLSPSASSLLPPLEHSCCLGICTISIMAKSNQQMSIGLPQYAVEQSPIFLDDFVTARQDLNRRTHFIMATLHLLLASRIALNQDTDFQYRFCALGLVAYMVVEGVSHIIALAKLHRDLRTWKNATFLICISMLVSRMIFFGMIFGDSGIIGLSRKVFGLIASIAKSIIVSGS